MAILTNDAQNYVDLFGLKPNIVPNPRNLSEDGEQLPPGKDTP